MLNKALLEEQISQLPVFQYSFFPSEELVFTERVRMICEKECPRYNTTWACPPAVGSVEECKKRCVSYPEVLMLSSVAEVSDIENMEETMATRQQHENLTYEIAQRIKEQGNEVLVLSTESCAQCEQCTYPNAPCRKPQRMFPCVESHGILVTEICEKCGMEFFNGNIVTWFSLIFIR